MIYLLEKPDDMITFPEGPTPDNFNFPVTVITALSTSEEDDIIWYIFKAKELRLALIPRKLDRTKAGAAQQLLDQMVSLSSNETAVVELAEKFRRAKQQNNLRIAEVWSEFYRFVENMRGCEIDNVKIFSAADKKIYHTDIVEGTIRLLSKFNTRNIMESLYKFSIVFGVSRVQLIRKKKCLLPGEWPFGHNNPRAQMRGGGENNSVRNNSVGLPNINGCYFEAKRTKHSKNFACSTLSLSHLSRALFSKKPTLGAGPNFRNHRIIR
jgi:hypothetical protein